MNSLNAISPIDGRYRSKVDALASYFSEGALIRYRVRVEIEYFIALGQVPQLPLQKLFAQRPELQNDLRAIYQNFTDDDALEVKEIEKTTNHDVKAVEYFIKRRFDTLGLEAYKEFIHFGLTSQDINNTSVPLSIKECHEQVLLPRYEAILSLIEERAQEWKDIPMLAHTHGQPASPTSLGKEMMVFAYRLRRQMDYFGQIPFSAKFGGATGNFNAHLAAYPEVDWCGFGNRFVAEHLGLERQQFTTQIENYDNMAAYFDNCKRLNVILIDFCRDIWTYVSMEYFKQKIKAGEVGSSAMPHKVNPIDFENAEGNLGLANAIFEHLSHKLPYRGYSATSPTPPSPATSVCPLPTRSSPSPPWKRVLANFFSMSRLSTTTWKTTGQLWPKPSRPFSVRWDTPTLMRHSSSLPAPTRK